MFRTISQTAIHYRASHLSQGIAGAVHGGDRLPWVRSGSIDNFAPLRSLDWQVHVYGTATKDLCEGCDRGGLALHEFPYSKETRHAGLRRDAAYLLRPDGYVALAQPDAQIAAIEGYLDSRNLSPLCAATPGR
jgi:hypothetical protein